MLISNSMKSTPSAISVKPRAPRLAVLFTDRKSYDSLHCRCLELVWSDYPALPALEVRISRFQTLNPGQRCFVANRAGIDPENALGSVEIPDNPFSGSVERYPTLGTPCTDSL